MTNMTKYQSQPVQWHKGQGKSHPYDSFEGSSKEGGWAVQGPLSIVGHFSEERLNLIFSSKIFTVLNPTWLKWKEQPRIWWVGNTSFHSSRIATYQLRFTTAKLCQNLKVCHNRHIFWKLKTLSLQQLQIQFQIKKNTIAKPETGQCKAVNKHLAFFGA